MPGEQLAGAYTLLKNTSCPTRIAARQKNHFLGLKDAMLDWFSSKQEELDKQTYKYSLENASDLVAYLFYWREKLDFSQVPAEEVQARFIDHIAYEGKTFHGFRINLHLLIGCASNKSESQKKRMKDIKENWDKNLNLKPSSNPKDWDRGNKANVIKLSLLYGLDFHPLVKTGDPNSKRKLSPDWLCECQKARLRKEHGSGAFTPPEMDGDDDGESEPDIPPEPGPPIRFVNNSPITSSASSSHSSTTFPSRPLPPLPTTHQPSSRKSANVYPGHRRSSRVRPSQSSGNSQLASQSSQPSRSTPSPTSHSRHRTLHSRFHISRPGEARCISGPPPAHSGPPTSHSGSPTPHSGSPTPHSGSPTQHSGSPTPHSGPPTSHSGHPTSHSGHPISRSGHHTSHAGPPTPQAGPTTRRYSSPTPKSCSNPHSVHSSPKRLPSSESPLRLNKHSPKSSSIGASVESSGDNCSSVNQSSSIESSTSKLSTTNSCQTSCSQPSTAMLETTAILASLSSKGRKPTGRNTTAGQYQPGRTHSIGQPRPGNHSSTRSFPHTSTTISHYPGHTRSASTRSTPAPVPPDRLLSLTQSAKTSAVAKAIEREHSSSLLSSTLSSKMSSLPDNSSEANSSPSPNNSTVPRLGSTTSNSTSDAQLSTSENKMKDSQVSVKQDSELFQNIGLSSTLKKFQTAPRPKYGGGSTRNSLSNLKFRPTYPLRSVSPQKHHVRKKMLLGSEIAAIPRLDSLGVRRPPNRMARTIPSLQQINLKDISILPLMKRVDKTAWQQLQSGRATETLHRIEFNTMQKCLLTHLQKTETAKIKEYLGTKSIQYPLHNLAALVRFSFCWGDEWYRDPDMEWIRSIRFSNFKRDWEALLRDLIGDPDNSTQKLMDRARHIDESVKSGNPLKLKLVEKKRPCCSMCSDIHTSNCLLTLSQVVSRLPKDNHSRSTLSLSSTKSSGPQHRRNQSLFRQSRPKPDNLVTEISKHTEEPCACHCECHQTEKNGAPVYGWDRRSIDNIVKLFHAYRLDYSKYVAGNERLQPQLHARPNRTDLRKVSHDPKELLVTNALTALSQSPEGINKRRKLNTSQSRERIQQQHRPRTAGSQSGPGVPSGSPGGPAGRQGGPAGGLGERQTPIPLFQPFKEHKFLSRSSPNRHSLTQSHTQSHNRKYYPPYPSSINFRPPSNTRLLSRTHQALPPIQARSRHIQQTLHSPNRMIKTINQKINHTIDQAISLGSAMSELHKKPKRSSFPPLALIPSNLSSPSLKRPAPSNSPSHLSNTYECPNPKRQRTTLPTYPTKEPSNIPAPIKTSSQTLLHIDHSISASPLATPPTAVSFTNLQFPTPKVILSMPKKSHSRRMSGSFVVRAPSKTTLNLSASTAFTKSAKFLAKQNATSNTEPRSPTHDKSKSKPAPVDSSCNSLSNGVAHKTTFWISEEKVTIEYNGDRSVKHLRHAIARKYTQFVDSVKIYFRGGTARDSWLVDQLHGENEYDIPQVIFDKRIDETLNGSLMLSRLKHDTVKINNRANASESKEKSGKC